mgnify:CR=1 FL=1
MTESGVAEESDTMKGWVKNSESRENSTFAGGGGALSITVPGVG